MKNNERGDQIERSEVWTIAIVVTLSLLLAEVTVIAIFWDRLCAKIAINALEYGAKQAVAPKYRPSIPPMQDRRATSYRPSPPQQSSQPDPLEDFKASTKHRVKPKTLEEMAKESFERFEIEEEASKKRTEAIIEAMGLMPRDANGWPSIGSEGQFEWARRKARELHPELFKDTDVNE